MLSPAPILITSIILLWIIPNFFLLIFLIEFAQCQFGNEVNVKKPTFLDY